MLHSTLLDRTFRANPRFELVLFDRLPPDEREALRQLREDPGFYGILRPRDGDAGAGGERLAGKAVDRDTALLFLTLREAGPLPAYLRSALGEAAAGQTVARLVADGVFEVESEGAFLSGAAAIEGRQGRRDPGAAGGRLAELSVAALRYGQALALDDPLRLSWRLYGYNRRPLTPRWQRLLPSAAAVQAHLGIGPGGANRPLLDRGWAPSSPSDAWLSWRSRRPEPSSASSEEGITFKLYVSPAPEALAGSFGAILEALAAARAAQFKVGSSATGLLRPDKIVAYFPSFERLAAAAERAGDRLAGVPAQGVPFTSEIAGDGLLSWGMDPPSSERMALSKGVESWRLWLTHRLARALLAARGAAGETLDVEPWRFALERVRLEGIDTDTWTPGGGLWRRV
jgi:hypothetical protein